CPYPRWVKYPLNVVPMSVDGYLGSRFPRAAFKGLGKNNAETQLLIAGCGTGQHSIEAALLFRGARILAVDLSRASLAYALRKTQELKIQGIEYAQADILGMAGIEREFDVIESMGVLHHLEDPLQGWKVLLGLLRPGGFMRIGLYSERARQPVVAIRQFIAARGYAPTPQGIRDCRRALRAETGLGDIGSVLDSVDFHASSAVRDLLFHVQEHRFGLAALRRLLASLGLNFIGFELEPSVLQRYAQRNPHDRAMNDLDAWDAYEAGNPLTFSGMYQFWVQKPRQAGARDHSPETAAA
ncbi:MAG: class I SAM-dependent methyltransferase, partial [Betaproteobacteria bacterium]|nr:class I SAM-dependent methyltransferase [Betaproteobacteria bacterium]